MAPLTPTRVARSSLYDFSQQFPYGRTEPGGKFWTIESSSSLYRVHGWGDPYFCINDRGNIAVRPYGNSTARSEEIDVMCVVERMVKEGMATPLIIRFPSILQHRLLSLNNAFDLGICSHNYKGRFQGVYPVKCNPDKFIVEDIVKFGKHLRFGLEAGSKPELMMAMSVLCGHGHPESLLICNGYKDFEYIHMAITARQLGLKSVIVLEAEDELDVVMRVSKRLGVQPVIGVRAKLSTKHGGHWGETSGEKGKFGLTPSEIVQVVLKLRRAGMLSCLQLLHFHIGSQIPSLELVDEGVSEASHIFCELYLMGANMKHFDIGGGLGVDYDGTNSASSDSSISYTLEEYADQVVKSIKLSCSLKNVRNPIITCESGRGLVSHHSVVVFDVLSARAGPSRFLEDIGVPVTINGLPHDMATLYDELYGYVRSGNYEKAYDCATSLKAEGTRLFKLGSFSLERRALMDNLFDTVKAFSYGKIFELSEVRKCDSRFGKEVDDDVGTYHINLSVFKSLPDSWAIRQLFPFVPIHRLNEEPDQRAVFSDLTCDSDGKIAKFIGHGQNPQPSKYLRVHPLTPNKPYYIGMFLAGAYQEVMGSMHNLFGMPNVVHVMNSSTVEGFKISKSISGQSIGDVVRLMQHDPAELLENLKCRVDESASAGLLKTEEGAEIFNKLARAFDSYTYLSNVTASRKSERPAPLENARHFT